MEQQNRDCSDSKDLRDGFVFFGSKKSVKMHNINQDSEQTTIKQVVNDFLIPHKQKEVAEQQRGRQF